MPSTRFRGQMDDAGRASPTVRINAVTPALDAPINVPVPEALMVLLPLTRANHDFAVGGNDLESRWWRSRRTCCRRR